MRHEVHLAVCLDMLPTGSIQRRFAVHLAMTEPPSVESLLSVFEQIDRMRGVREMTGGLTNNQIKLLKAIAEAGALSIEDASFLPHGVLRSLIIRGFVAPTNSHFLLTEEGRNALHTLPE